MTTSLSNDESEMDQHAMHPSSAQTVDASDIDESIRHRKRRRLTNPKPSSHQNSQPEDPDSDDYDLPANNQHSGSSGTDADGPKPPARPKHRIHVPQHEENLNVQNNTFVTQLTQPPSSPSRIRGPRWRKPPPPDVQEPSPSQPLSPPHENVPIAIPVDEFDEDDPLLAEAFLSSPEFEPAQSGVSQMARGPTLTAFVNPPRDASTYRQTTLFGQTATQKDVPATQARVHNWPLSNRSESPTHHKLDMHSLATWMYPTNLGTTRDYQFNIVQRGLFHNLLVALPTGLGKTFIAATIMLNWFRWTTEAQIVFVAPTKPLVSQQVDACFGVAGIPRSKTSMLTGNVQPAIRADEWQSKRVFFMTPQTLVHDLKTGICDPKKIVLLVVDEAHRATGNYAYVEVVKFLRRFNSSFRVLALTATPGASVEKVQEVIDGLDIARVEIRTEESIDIRQYVHTRDIVMEVFDNSDELTMALELFSKALQPGINKLNSQNAYWGKDPTTLTPFGLTKARQQWMGSDAGKKASFGLKGMVNTIFNVLASLAHALELLKYHGIGPFFGNVKTFQSETLDGSKNNKYAKQIAMDEHFKKLMNRLQGWVSNADFVGHPKLAYLKTVVLNHFMDAGEGRGGSGGRPPSDTRIMIFVHYRDSAEEVTRVLKRHEPMIRPHVFVGQSSAKGSEGMDQKTQLDIIDKFKKGTFNTIVATSIGEEGLDIGEVDLIVCYDSSASPIRMLQRMGRTGRKRAGNIVLLLMRGKEEESYVKAKDNYEKMQEMIASGTRFTFHDDRSPRIIPKDANPVVDKCQVDIPIENSQADLPEPKKRKAGKRPPKKFHMPDGVETGFSFLGGDKRSSKRSQKGVPVAEPKSLLDQDVAQLPSLNEVLLSQHDELQLDQRYCNIGGTDPQYVRKPRVNAFPKHQRSPLPVWQVAHSQVTDRIVRAFDAMRDPDRYSRKPPESDIFTTRKATTTQSQTISPLSSLPVIPKRHATISSSSSTIARFEDNEDNNSAGIRAVVGNMAAGDDNDASADSTVEDDWPDLHSLRSRSQDPAAEKPFYVSQNSVVVDPSDLDNGYDDLPDVDNLVSGNHTLRNPVPSQSPPLPSSSSPQTMKRRFAAARPGRRRFILDDDDDEDIDGDAWT